jgi:23S rRNA pseudouridine1911/1915/1917 synthase
MQYKVKKTASLLETVMEIYHGVSKQKAKQIISYSEFLVNGEKVQNHSKLIVTEGQLVEVLKIEKMQRQNSLPTKNSPIAIQFEDDYFLIALKPAGILSCNDMGQKGARSFHKLLEAFATKRAEQKVRLWPLHRLDKEVEGLIIFAKDEEIQEEMKENWQNVTKRYMALVEGKPSQEHGFIESWLKEGFEQKVMVFGKEVDGSKFAKTEYQYIRKEKIFHLLELTLHTGRKNQIRAQLASIGCPIVGDRKYGADDSVKRQIRLCAYKIEFQHPVTDAKVSLEYKPIARFFSPSKNEDENYKII